MEIIQPGVAEEPRGDSILQPGVDTQRQRRAGWTQSFQDFKNEMLGWTAPGGPDLYLPCDSTPMT